MTTDPRVEILLAPTSDLHGTVLAHARRLMDRAFDDFSDDDWDHALGGWHAAVVVEQAVVAHASVVERTLDVGERSFRAGYVEAVATAPEHQGHGFETIAMRRLAEVVEQRYELGALSTGEHHFYERLGWERWRGTTWVRDGDDRRRTPEEDEGIMVLRFGPSAGISLAGAITCEARPGDDW